MKKAAFKKDGSGYYEVLFDGNKAGSVRRLWDGWAFYDLNGTEQVGGIRTRELAAQYGDK